MTVSLRTIRPSCIAVSSCHYSPLTSAALTSGCKCLYYKVLHTRCRGSIRNAAMVLRKSFAGKIFCGRIPEYYHMLDGRVGAYSRVWGLRPLQTNLGILPPESKVFQEHLRLFTSWKQLTRKHSVRWDDKAVLEQLLQPQICCKGPNWSVLSQHVYLQSLTTFTG